MTLENDAPKTASNTAWSPAMHAGTCRGAPTDDATPFCNHQAHYQRIQTRKWKRSNYLPSPHFLQLNLACRFLNDALGGFGSYLVGSSITRRDYRDVDIRYILDDGAFDRLFRCDPKDADTGRAGWLNPLWSLMCTSISFWLREQTGLPVDFQIQRQTQANALHDGPRHALGIFLDYPGERPSDVVPEPASGDGDGDG
jgi:hypothetical protein